MKEKFYVSLTTTKTNHVHRIADLYVLYVQGVRGKTGQPVFS